jgi:8-oxo-dGTP diphosphatase
VAPEGAGGGRFVPNSEVDRLAWLTPAEAGARLSRPLDVTVLEAFLFAPFDTNPVILLRHATAEHRSPQRYPDDCERPLTAQGKGRAERLVPVLNGYGPLEIVSSPATRCLDTVRPFAALRQASIGVDPALSETAHEAEPRATASWIRALAAGDRPTLVCTHRPLLNAMLTTVMPPSGSSEGPHINGRAWTRREAERVLNGKLAPGSAWVLHVTRRLGPRRPPRLVAADRLRP